MKIHFCKSKDLGGFLIRLFTFSQWNHVAIEIDGVVFEALGFKGVVVTNISDWSWYKSETLVIKDVNHREAEIFLLSQLGKPYDWTALIALPFRKPWHNKDKWFCSELVAETLEISGKGLKRIPSYRVTPRDLWIALD